MVLVYGLAVLTWQCGTRHFCTLRFIAGRWPLLMAEKIRLTAVILENLYLHIVMHILIMRR